jgi:ribonuclease III
VTNPKGDLIDYCRTHGLGAPVFDSHQEGPEHQPTFSCDVLIQDQVYATGQGRTKRDAEKAAASVALEALLASPLEGDVGPDDLGPDDLEPEPEGEPVSHAKPAAPAVHEDDHDDGPWPIFPEVLAKCIEVANTRVPAGMNGIESMEQVRELTLELYQGLLEELGEYS